MSLFSRFFGSKPSAASKNIPQAIEYEGFRITPQPMSEAQGYRLCALIEKEKDGEIKSHTLVRADTISDLEACNEASVAKAKQMIDQMGDRLF